MEREGKAVRYLRATIVPTDESLLCVLEAASEDLVREAYARAEIPFERIAAVIPDGAWTEGAAALDEGGEMRHATFIAAAAALIAGALVVVAPATADGVTPAQLQEQGWACFVPPPFPNTIVCGNPAHGLPPVPPDPTGQPLYNFLYFDRATGEFRGTIHMIRADLYHVQERNLRRALEAAKRKAKIRVPAGGAALVAFAPALGGVGVRDRPRAQSRDPRPSRRARGCRIHAPRLCTRRSRPGCDREGHRVTTRPRVPPERSPQSAREPSACEQKVVRSERACSPGRQQQWT
jgi:hypothetical protein